ELDGGRARGQRPEQHERRWEVAARLLVVLVHEEGVEARALGDLCLLDELVHHPRQVGSHRGLVVGHDAEANGHFANRLSSSRRALPSRPYVKLASEPAPTSSTRTFTPRSLSRRRSSSVTSSSAPPIPTFTSTWTVISSRMSSPAVLRSTTQSHSPVVRSSLV